MKNLNKYLIPVLILIFCGLIGLGYFHMTREREILLDDLDRRAQILAKTLAPPAIRTLRNPPNSDEEDLAERLSGQGRTLGLLLCGTEGNLVARSATLTDLVSCQDPMIQEALKQKQPQGILREDKGQSLYYFNDPLWDRSKKLLGVLSVVHNASYIQQRTLSTITWTTFPLALLALFTSGLTYFISRRSFQNSIDKLLDWMKSPKKLEGKQPPQEAILKPVTREMERLAARLRSARETARELSEAERVSDLWTPARLKAHVVSQFGSNTLMVVSNREPYLHLKEHGHSKVIIPASGVVTALDPILRATSGLWIAHGSGDADRDFTDAEGKVLVPPQVPLYTLKRVWLTKEEEEGYYYGFSNEALWPLCHQTHFRPFFREEEWGFYTEVNNKFASAVLRECGKEKPFILIQDYHFTILPRLVRESRPDAVVGLFWHIPWPTPETFQICPWKRQILEGMLGANFLGFHLPSYCHNFLNTVNSLLPVRIDWDRSAIIHSRGTTEVKPFPISIQPWSERGMPTDGEFEREEARWRQELELEDVSLVVSVDRLDYTKGIPERLDAIDLFFEKNPSYRGKVSFIQLGAPSRIHIPRYRDLVTEIEKRVDKLNWKYASEKWKPVHLLKEHHDPQTVYLFLRMARACIVSSLADGMNLVAKEFAGARMNSDGVLILSEFTGVAREFQEALQLNPYDTTGFAHAIRLALEMPLEEQKKRMARLKSQVAEYNVYRWAADLVTEMTRQAETLPQKNKTTLSQSA